MGAMRLSERCEYKFPMTKEVALAILPEIAARIPPDANGGGKPYTVSSLYFDDEPHTLYHQTYNRDTYRVKLRLRVYGNDNGDTSDSFFEIKSKLLGRSTKERLRLPLSENDALWQGSINPAASYLVSGDLPRLTTPEPDYIGLSTRNDVRPRAVDTALSVATGDSSVRSDGGSVQSDGNPVQLDSKPVRSDGNLVQSDNKPIQSDGNTIRLDGKTNTDAVRQSLASLIYTSRLLPTAVVSYERLAFAAPGEARLRVTFDSALRIRTDRLDLRLGTGGIPVMPDDCCVMEVKSCENIPTWITKLLYKYRLSNRSYSKYGQTPLGYARHETIFTGLHDERSGYHNTSSLKI